MKLELKHLAPYLPYGLKLLNPNFPTDFPVMNASYMEAILTPTPYNQYKPILFPTSSLTQEIEINSKKFVPFLKIWRLPDDCLGDNKAYSSGFDEFLKRTYVIENRNGKETVYSLPENPLDMPFAAIQMLLEWKIDIFNLIPSGLAVDVKEIDNPYK